MPHRSPRLSAAVLTFALSAPQALAQGQPTLQLEEATIAELRAAMQSGLLTAEGLAARYALRIAAYDQTGANLNGVIRVNPDLVAEARQRDLAAHQGGVRGPLFGIPVLLKDNIDALPMPTTAGSVALAASFPPNDSFLTAKLRAAGAVILGKATLTEFANFMSTAGMPSGYSSLGGHGVNPYDPSRFANGAAVRTPGGSSSGSGISTAANLTSVAIGTETSGSILSPGSANGVVGLKPTVGLVSRDGILPITADQDTAGPMARTVTDAAIVLGVIAGYDPNDPATAACLSHGNCFADYTQFLDRTALQRARIAVPPVSLGGTQAQVMQQAIATLRAAGAFVADPYPIPNLNLGSICVSYPPPAGQSTVLIFGLKRDLNSYLASLGPSAPRRSLAEIIAYNNANAAIALVYGQSILLAADRYDTSANSADEQRYLADRQRDVSVSRGALDAVFAGPDGQRGTADDFDAIFFAANFGANAPARAGYPSIVVPGGLMATVPPVPFGVTFSGPAFSEPKLLALAYAFEQATANRVSPTSAPALTTDLIPFAFPGVRQLGTGCAGSNGVPTLATRGAPIIGNSAFQFALGSLPSTAMVFAGVSPQVGSTAFGACVVRASLPFALVLSGVSGSNGTATLDLAIPFEPVLSGSRIWVQGGAVDPLGTLLGVASMTAALEVTLGG